MNLTEKLVQAVKELSVKFFYDWYNSPGRNTEQGFDSWIKTEEGQRLLLQIRSVLEKEVGDREILEKADEMYGQEESLKEEKAFRQGAKWMREQITTLPDK